MELAKVRAPMGGLQDLLVGGLSVIDRYEVNIGPPVSGATIHAAVIRRGLILAVTCGGQAAGIDAFLLKIFDDARSTC